MRLSLFLILLSVLSVSAKNQTRLLKLNFDSASVVLSIAQKERIINEYVFTAKGDWLIIQTVSRSYYKKNRKLAVKLAKTRNRIITRFLLNNGLKKNNVIYKYDGTERVWIHKPSVLKSSASLNHKSEKSCYSFYNSQGLTARLPTGSSIVFKANSFEGFSDEKINVCIEEYSSKVDFVKFGVTAQGNRGMLESRGMFYIIATCNNVNIRLKRGVEYALRINEGSNSKSFYSFYGQEKGGELKWFKSSNEKFSMFMLKETSLDTVKMVNGAYVNAGIEDGELVIKSEGEVMTMTGTFSKLGWINCDRFYNEEEKITMNFKIKSHDSINVFVVFHEINSVMPASKLMNGIYIIEGIPKGESISIVAINMNNKTELGELGFVKTISSVTQKVSFKTERVSNLEMTRLLDDVIY
jgi:hypothetical protein